MTYYYNNITGESSWERPLAMNRVQQIPDGKPYRALMSATAVTYDAAPSYNPRATTARGRSRQGRSRMYTNASELTTVALEADEEGSAGWRVEPDNRSENGTVRYRDLSTGTYGGCGHGCCVLINVFYL